MSAPISFGKNEFTLVLGTAATARPVTEETPFCIVVLGDFSGRSSRELNDPGAIRRPRLVDIDNFDQVIRELSPRLVLSDPATPTATLELSFASLEDFHPDRILPQVRSLASLVEQRKAPPQAGQAPGAGTGSPTGTAPTESHEQTLTRLMGGAPLPSTPSAPPKPPSGAGGFDVQRLIRELAGPGVVPEASAQAVAVRSAVELELTRQLRAVLHHPRFQALESTWRSLDSFVRTFGAEELVKIALVDVSQRELLVDLNSTEDLAATGVARLLARGTGTAPWALALGCFSFGETAEDLQGLGRLARVAASTGTPFVAGASVRLLGCESIAAQPDPAGWRSLEKELADAWAAVRRLPEAAFVGLALPRFLLRQPYGKSIDPIETFPFEEVTAENSSAAYLWGAPAILCGHVLTEAFMAEGWSLSPSRSGELGELPVHRIVTDHGPEVTPSAEAWLSEHAADAILARGLMPILSIRGRDAARLVAVRSLREPPSPLAGRWED